MCAGVHTALQKYAQALTTAKYDATTHVLDFGTPTMTMSNGFVCGLAKLYVPRFFLDMYEALHASTPRGGGTFVVGTPGVGKSMMRNVHAWLIADSMKHADQQVMKDVHEAVRRRAGSLGTAQPVTGDMVRIVLVKFDGTRFCAGALVVQTRCGDGSVHAEATHLDSPVHYVLSRKDYVLADISSGESFGKWPVAWERAQCWGYSSPDIIQAQELTKQGMNKLLFTPSEWPVEELVDAATGLGLAITYHIEEENVAGTREHDAPMGTEANIRHRAALFGGIPRVCLATHPDIVENYHTHFKQRCRDVTDPKMVTQLFSWRGSLSVVSLMTHWPSTRWYCLKKDNGHFNSNLTGDALVCLCDCAARVVL